MFYITNSFSNRISIFFFIVYLLPNKNKKKQKPNIGVKYILYCREKKLITRLNFSMRIKEIKTTQHKNKITIAIATNMVIYVFVSKRTCVCKAISVRQRKSVCNVVLLLYLYFVLVAKNYEDWQCVRVTMSLYMYVFY